MDNNSSDLILAVWPCYKPFYNSWFMQELIESNHSVKWRDRRIKDDKGRLFADNYPDETEAIAAANLLNPSLKKSFSNLKTEPEIKRSLELKIDKALQARKRLQEEAQLMLSEALRRHQQEERPRKDSLKLAPESEKYRQELTDILFSMPYLKIVRVENSGGRWLKYLLYKIADGSWSKPYMVNRKSAEIAERAKIANGFDMSATMHWGKIKAEIRKILLPRANQLLQLASVQRMLADALAKGQHVLVSNGIVFWYEENGQVGWQVKQTTNAHASEDSAIWKEGSIVSTNHGRLVVLPYIKENGEKVKGHTKNGPNDGRASPRHPEQYVEIPFKLYDGDLMIGLFGELPYE